MAVSIHPRDSSRSLDRSEPTGSGRDPLKHLQQQIDYLYDTVRTISNQNENLLSLVQQLLAQRKNPDPSGGKTGPVEPPIEPVVGFEEQYAIAARDPKQAENFVKNYQAEGWAKRTSQSAMGCLLVKSAEQDCKRWELVVMTTGDLQRPAERVVLPGIWNLNNPNALLSDGGREGRKVLGGVFDLKNGPHVRIVSVARGDRTPDGIRITQPGILELPGLGTA